MIKEFGCMVIIALIIAVVLSAAVGGVSLSLADYGQACEETKQTQIAAASAERVAAIQAEAAIGVAAINADAQKKSSWAFSGFYLTRAVVWVVSGAVGLLWIVVGTALITKRMAKV